MILPGWSKRWMIWELVLKNAWKSKTIFLVQSIFAFRDRAEFEKKVLIKMWLIWGTSIIRQDWLKPSIESLNREDKSRWGLKIDILGKIRWIYPRQLLEIRRLKRSLPLNYWKKAWCYLLMLKANKALFKDQVFSSLT